MRSHEPIQVGAICRRLGTPYRNARYVLEEGHLPTGAEPGPGHGHHRRLTPAQAFWLAIVLKLKDSAVKTPLAARIADFAREAVRSVGRQMGWDPGFAPFDGHLATEHRWYVDVGDLGFIRLVTDACPSRAGLYEFDWAPLDRPREPAPLAAPAVIVRVDLARVARLLL